MSDVLEQVEFRFSDEHGREDLNRRVIYDVSMPLAGRAAEALLEWIRGGSEEVMLRTIAALSDCLRGGTPALRGRALRAVAEKWMLTAEERAQLARLREGHTREDPRAVARAAEALKLTSAQEQRLAEVFRAPAKGRGYAALDLGFSELHAEIFGPLKDPVNSDALFQRGLRLVTEADRRAIQRANDAEGERDVGAADIAAVRSYDHPCDSCSYIHAGSDDEDRCCCPCHCALRAVQIFPSEGVAS